jgi:hypothetical protein
LQYSSLISLTDTSNSDIFTNGQVKNNLGVFGNERKI